MPAVLFGSISTVADISELQREAFNEAFARHGLDWDWSPEQYRSMLGASGGQNRIARYAESRAQSVDAAAVHQTKSEIFQQSITGVRLQSRTGVLETIRTAKQAGTKVAFVTTTSADNVTALLAALSPALSADDFDLIVDSSSVPTSKPDAASYRHALAVLHERAEDCVAIEDNVDGVRSATAAGLRCVAFPNTNTSTQHFPGAHSRVTELDPVGLNALVA